MRKRNRILVTALMIAVLTFMAGFQVEALDTEIGETEVFLNGIRQHVRTMETNLGNLITDIIKENTGADIAVYNGGGIRDSAELGPITLEDATEILAFENEVETVRMNGYDVLKMLEHSVSSYPEVSGKFLQVSGLRFYFDPSEPAGERVKDVYVGGERLRMRQDYVVATNEFLVAGGDEYDMFERSEHLEVFETIDTQMFIEHIQQESPLFPKVEGRIVVLTE